MSTHFDLIVVGCGAAGLSAALSHAHAALAQGRRARVAVLERAGAEERGGATRWTGAWLRITAERELDPAFVDQMQEVSGGRADADYCRTLAGETHGTLDFLERNGVELIWFTQPFPNRNTGGGLGMPARGGLGIVEGLAAALERTPGVEFFYSTEAVRLSVNGDGRVDGIQVRGADGRLRTLRGDAVVLACGGFEGNPEMLTRYLGPRACDLPLVAPTLRHNRGDGLRMALEIGADTAGQFDMFHGEPADPRSQKPDAVLYGFPYGILVNRHAQRFFDEGQDSFDASFEALSYEIWRNQEQTAYFIGDQTTLGIPNFSATVLTDIAPISARSIAELADLLGLDAAALARTVADYNAAIGPGTFNPLLRDGKATHGLRPEKSNWAFPLDSPPFVAWPLTCAITFTFGGIRTDARARVLSGNGTPIPGLYAAGEVTGLYYHSYPAGTSVLRAATFGRIAGAHAAQAQE